jgi:hypothetical protein
MRINFRYGAAAGILAVAFGMLGPIAVQAGQTPGAPVPASAGTFSVQAPATHPSGITGRPVVLTSMIERSAWQHDIGLPGQQVRMLQQNYRCGYGYDHGRCCRYGGGYGHNRCCGYGGGYNRCCGYGYDHCRHYDHYDHSHYGAFGRQSQSGRPGQIQPGAVTGGLTATSQNAFLMTRI